MTRSRKIFLTAASIFACFLIFIVVDISRRTTFPGAKKEASKAASDSLVSDSSAKTATQPR